MVIASDQEFFFPRESRTSSKQLVNEPSVFEPLKFFCIYVLKDDAVDKVHDSDPILLTGAIFFISLAFRNI